MTPQQLHRVRELFEAVVDLDPAEARAWVDREAAADPAVRDEVWSLLDHHSRAGAFLAEPIVVTSPDLMHDEPLAAGTVIGPYTIVRELGRGGMGRVYLAQDSRLGRMVALKALAPHLGRDPRQRERLRREARAAAALTHPGICTVYALEEIGEDLYIAAEFIDGHTLRDEIDARRRPDPTELLQTARELAAALASAHAHGVVHRDLKPENIMRSSDGRLKILDFGLARSAHSERDLRVTHTGVLVGTPAYMAPEQRQHQPADARADVFAYGVVMYEYACGTHPVRASAPLEVPPPLDAVIARCLREAPAERFASAAEIVTALDESPDEVQRHAAWWRIHQLVVIALYIAAGAWGWEVKEIIETPLTVAIFLALTTAATIGGILRGHLLFTETFNPARLTKERRRTGGATLLVDLAFAVLLFLDAVMVSPRRALAAVVALSLALGIALAALVLEPATTAAAFGDGDDRD